MLLLLLMLLMLLLMLLHGLTFLLRDPAPLHLLLSKQRLSLHSRAMTLWLLRYNNRNVCFLSPTTRRVGPRTTGEDESTGCGHRGHR